MKKRPFILLTNDDGIHSDGLMAIYRELKKIGDVTIVAPLTEQSAVGHAITICDPIRVLEIPMEDNAIMYAVKGTPADCVKIAVRALLPQKPDVVISGINTGSNTSMNVLYSGTVSAATEGTILGIPSAAISLDAFDSPDFSVAATMGRKVASLLLTEKLPPETVLNVNVPAVSKNEITGIRITRQGLSRFEEIYDRKVDPRGRIYYWLTGKMPKGDEEHKQSDTIAIKENAISITPLKIQITNKDFIESLEKWDFKI